MVWWFFFPIAVIGGLALIVAVSGLIIWVIFASGGSNKKTHSGQRDQSLSIVKERYAKGEITKEQYDQLTKDLKIS